LLKSSIVDINKYAVVELKKRIYSDEFVINASLIPIDAFNVFEQALNNSIETYLKSNGGEKLFGISSDLNISINRKGANPDRTIMLILHESRYTSKALYQKTIDFNGKKLVISINSPIGFESWFPSPEKKEDKISSGIKASINNSRRLFLYDEREGNEEFGFNIGRMGSEFSNYRLYITDMYKTYPVLEIYDKNNELDLKTSDIFCRKTRKKIDPFWTEILQCEINLVKPDIIILMGKACRNTVLKYFASELLMFHKLSKEFTLSKECPIQHTCNWKIDDKIIKVLESYHYARNMITSKAITKKIRRNLKC
jgi:hypothetical protein